MPQDATNILNIPMGNKSIISSTKMKQNLIFMDKNEHFESCELKLNGLKNLGTKDLVKLSITQMAEILYPRLKR